MGKCRDIVQYFNNVESSIKYIPSSIPYERPHAHISQILYNINCILWLIIIIGICVGFFYTNIHKYNILVRGWNVINNNRWHVYTYTATAPRKTAPKNCGFFVVAAVMVPECHAWKRDNEPFMLWRYHINFDLINISKITYLPIFYFPLGKTGAGEFLLKTSLFVYIDTIYIFISFIHRFMMWVVGWLVLQCKVYLCSFYRK